MAVEKRVTWTEHDEPIVAITITGWDDAFRFSWAMAHLQCDFSDVGRRIGGSLRRHIGASRFRELNKHFTSNRTLRWVRDDAERGEMEVVLGKELTAMLMEHCDHFEVDHEAAVGAAVQQYLQRQPGYVAPY